MSDPGNGENPTGSTPPPPPPPPPPPAAPEATAAAPLKWYENVGIVVLCLICCWPIGLAFVWMNRSWKQKTKIIVTAVVVGLMVVGSIVAAVTGGGSSSSSSSGTSATTEAKTTTTKAGDTATTKAPAVATACKDTPNTESYDSKKQGLYPSRAGVQKTDHEAAIGDCVRINGLTTYVTAVDVITDSLTKKQGILATVSVTNRDKTAKSFNPFEWKIQTPQGTLESMTIIFGDTSNRLSSGELVTGGSVTGTVAFDYAGAGTYYLVYDPIGSIQPDVGVWGVNVP